jgi:hypothetical protein
VNGTVNVLNSVIDYFVCVVTFETLVGKQLIGIKSGASLNALLDFILKDSLFPVLNNNRLDVSTAFNKSNHGGFVLSSCSGDSASALRDMHIPRLAADKRFVNLNVARELHERPLLHGEPDAVECEPSGLLSNANVACNFATADAILTIGNQPYCSHPLIHAERAVLKNRPHFHRELLLASFAEPETPRRNEGLLIRIATRAADLAIGPAESHCVLKAALRIGKVGYRLLQCLGAFSSCVHEYSLA